MAQKCEYAEVSKFGKLNCTVGENQLCSFQRYCSRASEWQNSKAFSTCERRRNVGKKKSNNAYTSANIESKEIELKKVEIPDVKLINVENNAEVEVKINENKDIKVNETENQELENKEVNIDEVNVKKFASIKNEDLVKDETMLIIPILDEKVPIKKTKKLKKQGKVIGISKISIVVVDENGNGIILYNRPNVKIGDIIEF